MLTVWTKEQFFDLLQQSDKMVRQLIIEISSPLSYCVIIKEINDDEAFIFHFLAEQIRQGDRLYPCPLQTARQILRRHWRYLVERIGSEDLNKYFETLERG